MVILGVNSYHGDASAVLLQDGKLVAAVEEERVRRVKHWAGFPRKAIDVCLDMAGVRPEQIDYFAISRNPRANLFRKAIYTLKNLPSRSWLWDRLRNSSRVRDVAGQIAHSLGLRREWVERRMQWVEHHPAHLASAFWVSPFDEAAVCAIDGSGDFVSTSLAVGRGTQLQAIERIYFPHSLGLLYQAVTQYLGFPNYGDEYKVMGLAPYGQPDYVGALRQLIRLNPKGRFELDLSYFRLWSEGVSMTWDDGAPTVAQIYSVKLEKLLGPARRSDEALAPRHEAIAASLQAVFEEAVPHILNALHRKTRVEQLCLAGGCAMNSVMNGKIRERTPFKRVFIQPAAADNGTALGAAFYVWHHMLGQQRSFVMDHGFLGPEFSDEEVERELQKRSVDLTRDDCNLQRIVDDEELCTLTASRIAEGRIVGWFQGRMEWGSRALGNRSILADARRADMRDIINTKIKLREKFRPFAPSILEEALDEYFVGAAQDAFMTQVYPVRPEKRSIIPAVTHVDGSGRPQTVSRKTNPLFWGLLKAFEKQTGVPVLLNTSFNENEPIVYRPAEALDCFQRTGMDVLVIGTYTLEKSSVSRGD